MAHNSRLQPPKRVVGRSIVVRRMQLLPASWLLQTTIKHDNRTCRSRGPLILRTCQLCLLIQKHVSLDSKAAGAGPRRRESARAGDQGEQRGVNSDYLAVVLRVIDGVAFHTLFFVAFEVGVSVGVPFELMGKQIFLVACGFAATGSKASYHKRFAPWPPPSFRAYRRSF